MKKMRERLYELIVDAENALCQEKSYTTDTERIEKIADHLLAEGVIVPPCKVGDTVYIIEHPYTFMTLKKVVEGEVVSIHLHEHGLFLRVLFDTKKINGCVDYNLNWRLGKHIFLTKAEAEKALAELNKEGKV